MALTPEDVVNKRFQPTKFREGYDQDEVDDFLDEVVVELRRLNGENEELRQQLASAGSRGDEAPAAVAPVPSFAEPVAAVPAPVAAPVAAAPVEDEQTSTTNLLQLARRLHEEHVREGIEKRDALIAEGHATAARVVAEAEAKQRAQIGALDAERQGLETRIDELRNFERDYRSKLKGYIEGQLRELDASGGASAAPASAPAGQTFGSPVSASGDQQAPSFQGFGA
ncbi:MULTISPECIES: DivIVA domain-containing protein [unclassified Leifsonia]|uniref:DivIVA domain-containing protein n=1 Tax=unclassified Leifsonia TaxID=2663824 RepID=UPI0006FDD433|nr:MULTISPECIES: DivIVA domain-containing protein [unclassified Leifsonia]KQX06724.1 cell division protein [Leifsonia sp. Root1293]KRA11008.1 cell division protein [Leifsonia sp. Root60]